jgi:hypothetical protein
MIRMKVLRKTVDKYQSPPWRLGVRRYEWKSPARSSPRPCIALPPPLSRAPTDHRSGNISSLARSTHPFHPAEALIASGSTRFLRRPANLQRPANHRSIRSILVILTKITFWQRKTQNDLLAKLFHSLNLFFCGALPSGVTPVCVAPM